MSITLKRKSIRRYTDQPVSDSDLKDLLKAAMNAPSAGNSQPWHYIVIRDRNTLKEIPTLSIYAQMAAEAPAAILVCGDPSLENFPGFWPQDCAAATENILIAAEEKNIGTVWCGIYTENGDISRPEKFRKFFGIPENIIPFSLVVLGYKGEEKPPTDRYNEERVHYDKWQG